MWFLKFSDAGYNKPMGETDLAPLNQEILLYLMLELDGKVLNVHLA